MTMYAQKRKRNKDGGQQNFNLRLQDFHGENSGCGLPGYDNM